jgi:type I restriction enzyme M protein
MELICQYLFPIEDNKVKKHRNRKNNNQYFTPEVVVEKALSLIPNIKIENIIDPAVGNGIFLKIAQKKYSQAKLFGIDIDAKIIEELKVFNFQNANFFVGDALLNKTWQDGVIQKVISNGGFDLVVGNPPFSSWFQRIKEPNILANYKLANINGKLMKSQGIEILFLELFITLAKNKGYIIIVLPDGILSNPQYKYVREFITRNTEVKHIINLPRNIFKDTSAKTSILILEKRTNNNLDYKTHLHNLQKSGIIDNSIEVNAIDLINRMDYYYYNNLKCSSLNDLTKKGIKFVPLKNLIVYCKTGKTLYGKERTFSDNGIRFLHATNIDDIGINYIKDEKFISPLSKMNFPNAYAKVGDILFVRVGVGCAGRVAIVDTRDDEGIATDYIHIFRVRDINPYFLVIYLKTKYGKESIDLLKHGVGTISINKTDLLSISIPIVSENIQKEIGNEYKSILKSWKLAILNHQETFIYKEMIKNLIIKLERILEEDL